MKILIPTDFSPCAAEAARYGIDMAERFGASVTLLHAFVVPIYPTPEGSALVPDLDTVESGMYDAAEALDELRQRIGRPGVTIETRVLEGRASELIPRIAERDKYDLIVMGTHGRTGLRHILLGSVAERVVRTAPCPVMTVRLPRQNNHAHHHLPAVPLL